MEDEKDVSEHESENIDDQKPLDEDEHPKIEDEIQSQEADLNKENLITSILKSFKKREDLIRKNDFFQHRLSVFVKGCEEKDYFQKLELPVGANEETFKAALENINNKFTEIEEVQQESTEQLVSLETKKIEKEKEWNELNSSFVELKGRIAFSSVNSDNGQRFAKEEVREFLRKEEEVRKVLEEVQLQSIKKRYYLKELIEEKMNLVEGPLDFGEYETMCTGTENNAEVIKQLKEEIRGYAKKAANVVNILSHLRQKLHSAQTDKCAAKEKEISLEDELKEMRNYLFEEKLKYATMNEKNEELQHRSILLQHPRLIEDHNNLLVENETIKNELEALKNTYKSLMKITSK
ncbi:uncharacterized protein TNCT_129761 [Trichonephila clavata]|uniref:DUF4201 domain-containing protein n=1 Tax=Trichonephila clavata TaxID=2740835 RepID=A0A8X6KE50_TRICU|nr:uncharacterized protein TNCT_129761 [Trichonephila clavata]